MFTRQGIFGLLVISVLAVALSIGHSGARAAESGSAQELAQSGNVMQCMEQCIRNEGSSEKATCKSRCAGNMSKRSKKRDCMGVYKQCKSACGKGKKCKRACKQNLMSCS